MAQFDVFENRDEASRKGVPYLLDIQSDLLEDLATRVVIPLARQSRDGLPGIDRLMPAVEIDGVALTVVTPQLAGVPRAILGPRVASLAGHRHDIVAALDVLITGV